MSYSKNHSSQHQGNAQFNCEAMIVFKTLEKLKKRP